MQRAQKNNNTDRPTKRAPEREGMQYMPAIKKPKKYTLKEITEKYYDFVTNEKTIPDELCKYMKTIFLKFALSRKDG